MKILERTQANASGIVHSLTNCAVLPKFDRYRKKRFHLFLLYTESGYEAITTTKTMTTLAHESLSRHYFDKFVIIHDWSLANLSCSRYDVYFLKGSALLDNSTQP